MEKREQKLAAYWRQLFEDVEAGGGTDTTGESGTDNDGGDPDGENNQNASKRYSDEDLDRIISKKFSDWQKKQQKAVDQAKKLAEMNAEERAKHERDELQKELDELKRANTLNELQREARRMLSDDGIHIPDGILKNLIGEDAEATKTATQEFAKAYKKAVQDGIKEALKGKTPPAGGTSTITKEDILKIKDRQERQRMISENLELFRKV